MWIGLKLPLEFIEVLAQRATEPFSWSLDNKTYPIGNISFASGNQQVKVLGYTREVTINSDRDNKVIYVLGREINVRPFEVYPGPTKYTIKLSNLVLYDKDILKDFFVSSPDNVHFGVYSQSIPFHFQFALYKPYVKDDGTSDIKLQDTITAYGCWLEKFPLEFKSEGDLHIVQDIDITATLIQYQKP